MRNPEISLFDVSGRLCVQPENDLVVPSALEDVQMREWELVIHESIGRLTHEEQLVIRRRFGLAAAPPDTQEAIGRDLNKSRQRVQQIEDSAKAKLKVLLENKLGDWL